MDVEALQSHVTFARRAYDRAERYAERAEDAEMSAIIAWAHMREARKRMRARRRREYDISELSPSHAMTSSGGLTNSAA